MKEAGSRALCSEQAKERSTIGALQTVGNSWNSSQLRVGDHVVVSAAGSVPAFHKSQFDLHNSLKLAFGDGANTSSRHCLDVRATVVDCANEAQIAAAKKRLVDSTSGYLFCERSYDDTPQHLTFGHLSEQLAPSVRYIVPSAHRDRVGKPLCSYNDVVQFGIKTAQQHGVMDVFCTHLLVDLGLGDKAGSRAEQRSCRQTLVQRKCARVRVCAQAEAVEQEQFDVQGWKTTSN